MNKFQMWQDKRLNFSLKMSGKRVRPIRSIENNLQDTKISCLNLRAGIEAGKIKVEGNILNENGSAFFLAG